LEIVQAELRTGRRCHIYAVYTQKRDVTRRLESILAREGIRVAVLTSDVPTEKREAWFETKLQQGIQVTICHPKIIETGLDLLSHPSMIFYESGYSLHTLRQASRRSWRIGQRQPVRVYYLYYGDTMQSACLRLMGKKLLVSLAMEGKFYGEGLQTLDDGDDILTAMAKELVTERGIGESANAVWQQLRAESSTLAPPKPVLPEPSTKDEDAVPVPPPSPPPLQVPAFLSALHFGSNLPSVLPRRRREKRTQPHDAQFSLFEAP
ncbi:MAG: hypothetical protein LV479_00395, partial [Methylacidiphilales bacterium]|nr:hypothetical protein [Candidatus Methylacidiphilales bacterium]